MSSIGFITNKQQPFSQPNTPKLGQPPIHELLAQAVIPSVVADPAMGNAPEPWRAAVNEKIQQLFERQDIPLVEQPLLKLEIFNQINLTIGAPESSHAVMHWMENLASAANAPGSQFKGFREVAKEALDQSLIATFNSVGINADRHLVPYLVQAMNASLMKASDAGELPSADALEARFDAYKNLFANKDNKALGELQALGRIANNARDLAIKTYVDSVELPGVSAADLPAVREELRGWVKRQIGENRVFESVSLIEKAVNENLPLITLVALIEFGDDFSFYELTPADMPAIREIIMGYLRQEIITNKLDSNIESIDKRINALRNNEVFLKYFADIVLRNR